MPRPLSLRADGDRTMTPAGSSGASMASGTCSRPGLQLEVNAVRQAEQSGELLEGGNVAQGDTPSLHQRQTVRVQRGQNLEPRRLAGMDQFDGLPCTPVKRVTQPAADDHGAGLGDHRRPIDGRPLPG
jgi:hypothetical protein